jgi:DNA-binding winged helix-turn-helix (wHTH) protein/Tol biopolymer transport system component
MSKETKQFYEFGPFRAFPDKLLLLRDNQPVPLPPKAFETLLVLVRHSETVVLKDHLMESLWPDTFVEESNLAQNIFVLRKTLGATAADQRYIVTIPGRGYRFTEKVRVVSEEDSVGVEADIRTRVVTQEVTREVTQELTQEESLVRVGPLAVAPTKPARGRRWGLMVATLLALAALLVTFWPAVPPPRVLRIRQITHLGTLVHNTKLLSDGVRIYFRTWEGNDRMIRYVSPHGGEIFPVEKAFSQMDLDDISPSGSEFLAMNLGDQSSPTDPEFGTASVWRVPLPSGSPQALGGLRANNSAWSPDGHRIAYSIGTSLFLAASDGSKSRKLATLPGAIIYLLWSPEGERLRFSVVDARSTGVALWQFDFSTNTVRHLLPDWPSTSRLLPGGWTADGCYFFFSASGDGTRNIWTIREKDETLRRVSPQPVQLTTGPLTFFPPLPSRDGKSVFAVGEQLRGQLLRYDPVTNQYAPYAKGISADHLAFSHDGQWIAYVEFPGGVLVRSRVDGSERRQLTFPPMRALNPQWSPDDAQIAFHASAQTGVNDKIYLVSRDGGLPTSATPITRDRQTHPSWSADGNSLMFSSADEDGSNPGLRILDLHTKHVALLPGSAGLQWGQFSPDGRYAVAIEDTTSRLKLYDITSHLSQTLAEQADYPHWSADGQYVYFSTPYFGGKSGGVYRWKVSSTTTQLVAKNPEFLLGGVYGVGFSLTPDGQILMLRDLSTRDLYALDLELP